MPTDGFLETKDDFHDFRSHLLLLLMKAALILVVGIFLIFQFTVLKHYALTLSINPLHGIVSYGMFIIGTVAFIISIAYSERSGVVIVDPELLDFYHKTMREHSDGEAKYILSQVDLSLKRFR